MPRIDYPVNHERSAAMRTRRCKNAAYALETLYFTASELRRQAQRDGVHGPEVEQAVALVEAQTINWYNELVEQDLSSSMQELADTIWNETQDARLEASKAKAAGFTPLVPGVVHEGNYAGSRFEYLTLVMRRALETVRGFVELQGRLYQDPVSGEWKRKATYVDPFDTSNAGDPVLGKSSGSGGGVHI